MLVEQDPQGRDSTEALLAKLNFAVAPFDSVEKAVAVLRGLSPHVIVANGEAAASLRMHAPSNRDGGLIPIVALTEAATTPDDLVDAVRRALAAAKVS
jgi:hypothetical protein